VITTLREFYGLQATPPADLFQFFVWEILSEHALPPRRDLAWQALRRLPALTPDAMFRAPSKELLDAIGTAGPHRDEKLERIRAVVGEFKRHRDALTGEALARAGLLRAARTLRRLDAVPRPVRARALLFSAGHCILPVDEDVQRVAARLGDASEQATRAASRRWLTARLPRDAAAYRDAVVYIRHHAHHTCTKTAPHCGVCPLRSGCAFGQSVQRGDPTP
jgi:endonuclease III